MCANLKGETHLRWYLDEKTFFLPTVIPLFLFLTELTTRGGVWRAEVKTPCEIRVWSGPHLRRKHKGKHKRSLWLMGTAQHKHKQNARIWCSHEFWSCMSHRPFPEANKLLLRVYDYVCLKRGCKSDIPYIGLILAVSWWIHIHMKIISIVG